MTPSRDSPETEKATALEANSLQFAREFSDAKSQFDAREEVELSAFEKRKAALESQIEQLDRQYRANAKTRRQTYLDKLEALWHAHKPAHLSRDVRSQLPRAAGNAPSQQSETTRPQRRVVGNSDNRSPEPANPPSVPTVTLATQLADTHRGTATEPGLPAPAYATRSKRKAPEMPSPRKRARKGYRGHPSTSEPARSRLNPETIAFEDVFQGGTAEPGHMIIEFPRDSDEWYVLRCVEHGVHFKLNALLGAAKHLRSDEHGGLPRDDALSVKLLGIRVRDCNSTLAKQNNDVFRRAQTNVSSLNKVGKQVQAASPIDRIMLARRGKRNRTLDKDSPLSARSDQPPRESFDGITDPVVGEVYRGFWKKRKPHAVLLLPRGALDVVGMSGTLADTQLLKSLPICYRYGQGTEGIEWEEGYEDGGCLITQRTFPILYFVGDSYKPHAKPGIPELPKGSMFGWLDAQDLEPLDFRNPHHGSVVGYGCAREFYTKLEAARSKQAQDRLPVEIAEGDQSPSPASHTTSISPRACAVDCVTFAGPANGTCKECHPEVSKGVAVAEEDAAGQIAQYGSVPTNLGGDHDGRDGVGVDADTHLQCGMAASAIPICHLTPEPAARATSDAHQVSPALASESLSGFEPGDETRQELISQEVPADPNSPSNLHLAHTAMNALHKRISVPGHESFSLVNVLQSAAPPHNQLTIEGQSPAQMLQVVRQAAAAQTDGRPHNPDRPSPTPSTTLRSAHREHGPDLVDSSGLLEPSHAASKTLASSTGEGCASKASRRHQQLLRTKPVWKYRPISEVRKPPTSTGSTENDTRYSIISGAAARQVDLAQAAHPQPMRDTRMDAETLRPTGPLPLPYVHQPLPSLSKWTNARWQAVGAGPHYYRDTSVDPTPFGPRDGRLSVAGLRDTWSTAPTVPTIGHRPQAGLSPECSPASEGGLRTVDIASKGLPPVQDGTGQSRREVSTGLYQCPRCSKPYMRLCIMDKHIPECQGTEPKAKGKSGGI